MGPGWLLRPLQTVYRAYRVRLALKHAVGRPRRGKPVCCLHQGVAREGEAAPEIHGREIFGLLPERVSTQRCRRASGTSCAAVEGQLWRRKRTCVNNEKLAANSSLMSLCSRSFEGRRDRPRSSRWERGSRSSASRPPQSETGAM